MRVLRPLTGDSSSIWTTWSKASPSLDAGSSEASAAHGYCVGLIIPASLAGAVYSQLAVRSTWRGQLQYAVPVLALTTRVGVRCTVHAAGGRHPRRASRRGERCRE